MTESTDIVQKKYNKVSDLLKQMKPQIMEALPNHVTPDRLLRVALTSIRLNPALLECSTASLLGGILQSAQLGFEINSQGQAYLIPYNNRKTGEKEAQFQIGYKGLLELFYRSEKTTLAYANEVREGDTFHIEYGTTQILKHIPILEDRLESPVVAYYAVAQLKDGTKHFHVITKKEAEKHRDKFSKAKTFGPWIDLFDEMAKKTVLKKLLKYLPLSVELQMGLSVDGSTKKINEKVTSLEETVDVTDYDTKNPKEGQKEINISETIGKAKTEEMPPRK